MANDNARFREEVKGAIERAIARGYKTLDEVLLAVGSPDPWLVRELFDQLTTDTAPAASSTPPTDLRVRATHARRLSAQLPLSLPAPDPMRCQWWFTLDSVADLAERVWDYSAAAPAAFLGAPTVGFHYAHWLATPLTVLDVDQDLIDSLLLPKHARKIRYDVADDVPTDLAHQHSVILIDPPWYPDSTRLFLTRAHKLLVPDGFILCVLPSRLIRPGVVEERSRLLAELLTAHVEVVALESDYVTYRVPEFEAQAYKKIEEFSGRQWRKGDLLILRAPAASSLPPPADIRRSEPMVFYRDRSLLRVFLDEARLDTNLPEWIAPIPDFENTVSSRGLQMDRITLWSTDKKAASLRESSLAKDMLVLWAEAKSPALTAAALAEAGVPVPQAKVEALQTCLQIWMEPPVPRCRRTPEHLQQVRSTVTSAFASQPSSRSHPYEPDRFRIDFQRDRDRVLWSGALRRLANKTQLFPVISDDHLRRRLSHSIEVMQLASTIAVSFGLDRDLTEAGALAHDLGHTPFGHAGEHALNTILNEIDPHLGGFNHYEHGADVVRWLEDVYRSPGAGDFSGLNLTKETVECILKHTYHRNEEPLGQTTIIKNSKHTDIDDNSCHLEGQAVRIADKISYLISDLEDGIRLGAFDYQDLVACRMFERPPIDIAPAPGESLRDRFISQRRSILRVLMEDILEATDERLGQLASLGKVRAKREYVIDYSPAIQADVTEVWDRLQVGRLHKHPSVVAESMRATRIVRDLFLLYAIAPRLIPGQFRESHRRLQAEEYIRWYERRVGQNIGVPKRLVAKYTYEHTLGSEPRTQGDNWLLPTADLVVAKDYVASLTDTSAVAEHRTHCADVR